MKTSLTKQQLLHMIQENLTNIFYPENYLTFLNQLSYFHEESIEHIIAPSVEVTLLLHYYQIIQTVNKYALSLILNTQLAKSLFQHILIYI